MYEIITYCDHWCANMQQNAIFHRGFSCELGNATLCGNVCDVCVFENCFMVQALWLAKNLRWEELQRTVLRW